MYRSTTSGCTRAGDAAPRDRTRFTSSRFRPLPVARVVPPRHGGARRIVEIEPLQQLRQPLPGALRRCHRPRRPGASLLQPAPAPAPDGRSPAAVPGQRVVDAQAQLPLLQRPRHAAVRRRSTSSPARVRPRHRPRTPPHGQAASSLFPGGHAGRRRGAAFDQPKLRRRACPPVRRTALRRPRANARGRRCCASPLLPARRGRALQELGTPCRSAPGATPPSPGGPPTWARVPLTRPHSNTRRAPPHFTSVCTARLV